MAIGRERRPLAKVRLQQRPGISAVAWIEQDRVSLARVRWCVVSPGGRILGFAEVDRSAGRTSLRPVPDRRVLGVVPDALRRQLALQHYLLALDGLAEQASRGDRLRLRRTARHGRQAGLPGVEDADEAHH